MKARTRPKNDDEAMVLLGCWPRNVRGWWYWLQHRTRLPFCWMGRRLR